MEEYKLFLELIFYPAVVFMITVCLWVIADSLEKIAKK